MIDAGQLRALVARRDLRAELWRLVRAPGSGLDSLDTGRMRMSFPCRLGIRLRSGRTLELEGAEHGACGHPLEEQRQVVEEKRRLVGLEQPVATA